MANDNSSINWTTISLAHLEVDDAQNDGLETNACSSIFTPSSDDMKMVGSTL
jgi:hypothetical protein